MKYNSRTAQISTLLLWNLLFCLLHALLTTPVVAQISDTAGQKNVLVLYDEQDELPGLAIIDRSIRSTLTAGSTDKLNIYSESLDLSRFQNEGYDQFLRGYYRQKYSGKKIDAVIAVMGPSLDFLLAHMEEISPGTPIVFCGVTRKEIESRKLGPNVTGVMVKRDFKGSLEVALRLHPDTRRVVYIAGTSDFDKMLIEEAMRELRDYEGRLEFTYLTNLPFNDILKEVSQLPPQTIVLISTVFRDGAGESFVPHDVVSLLSQKANAPVYGFVDQFLGRGIVGGHLYSMEQQGNKAAELVLRILGGERAADVPIVEDGGSLDMFDARELQRWGISEQKLPPGSVVRFKDPSLWEKYKWHILGLVSLCLLEGGLIFFLLVNRARRRRAEKENERLARLAEDEHRRLDAIVSNVPGVVWESFLQPDGNTRKPEFVSDYAEKMLGYSVEEWLSKPSFSEAIAHEDDRERFARGIEEILKSGREDVLQVRWRTKDGRLLWVESHVAGMRDETGKIVGLRGVTIDITGRKLAEEALENLSGQLIQTREEERARIARELHDGVSQSVTLIEIELGQLVRNPPQSQSELREFVQNIIEQNAAIRTEIHRMAHDLHPSKLDKLGLVVALKGLCVELSRSCGLKIDFHHDQIPQPAPRDVSLCLYRVAQESLNNVIKYSGAKEAQVELRGTGNSLRLRISDSGCGFDVKSVESQKGLGLLSMRERLRLVGGTIRIDSRVSKGTIIEVEVPLPEPGETNRTVQLSGSSHLG